MSGLPPGFGGGIPKPRKPGAVVEQKPEPEPKEFRITSTMSSASGPRPSQVKRTHLAGLGKPHSMAQQNEQIKRMLGISTPNAAEEAMSASSLMRKSSRLAPIEKPLDQFFEDSSSFSGTHRASSQIGAKKQLSSHTSQSGDPKTRTQSVKKTGTESQFR